MLFDTCNALLAALALPASNSLDRLVSVDCSSRIGWMIASWQTEGDVWFFEMPWFQIEDGSSEVLAELIGFRAAAATGVVATVAVSLGS
jgi:hypothetical protein